MENERFRFFYFLSLKEEVLGRSGSFWVLVKGVGDRIGLVSAVDVL